MNEIRDQLYSVLVNFSPTGQQQAPAKEKIRTVSQKVLMHLFDLLGRTREDCDVNSSNSKPNTIPQDLTVNEDEEFIQVLASPLN